MSAPDERRCSATSKTTGQQCGQFARPGARVCFYHGGAAPQVRAKAEQRVTLAAALASSPRRAPWEILLDVVHNVDVVAQRARAEVVAGNLAPETFEAFVGALEQSGRWAKVAIDANLDERRISAYELVAGEFVALIDRVLEAAELSPTQQASARLALVSGLEGIARGGETV